MNLLKNYLLFSFFSAFYEEIKENWVFCLSGGMILSSWEVKKIERETIIITARKEQIETSQALIWT